MKFKQQLLCFVLAFIMLASLGPSSLTVYAEDSFDIVDGTETEIGPEGWRDHTGGSTKSRYTHTFSAQNGILESHCIRGDNSNTGAHFYQYWMVKEGLESFLSQSDTNTLALRVNLSQPTGTQQYSFAVTAGNYNASRALFLGELIRFDNHNKIIYGGTPASGSGSAQLELAEKTGTELMSYGYDRWYTVTLEIEKTDEHNSTVVMKVLDEASDAVTKSNPFTINNPGGEPIDSLRLITYLGYSGNPGNEFSVYTDYIKAYNGFEAALPDPGPDDPTPTPPPEVVTEAVIISPESGGYYSRGVPPVDETDTSIAVTVTAKITSADGDITDVKFYNNGVLIDGPVESNDNHYSIVIENPSRAANIITAAAEDETGGHITAEPIVFYTNIALGKPVEASEPGHDDTSNPESVVDGIMHKDALGTDKWYIRDKAAAYVDIGLQQPYIIYGTIIHSGRTASSSGRVRELKIEYCDDRGEWAPVPGAHITGNSQSPLKIVFDQPVPTEKLRYTLLNAGVSSQEYRIREIEVFGVENDNPPAVSIVNLTDGALVDENGDNKVVVEVDPKGERISSLALLVDDELKHTLPGLNGVYTYEFPLGSMSYGTYQLEAIVYNSLGAAGKASLTLNVIPFDLINRINSAGSAAIAAAVVLYESLLEELGLYISLYSNASEQVRQEVCDSLAGQPDYALSIQGLEKLGADFNKAVAVALVNEAVDTDGVLDGLTAASGYFKESLQIGENSYFAGLTTANQMSVLDKLLLHRAALEGENFASFSGLEDTFENNIVMVVITDIYWAQLETVLIEFNHLLQLPLSGSYAGMTDTEKSKVLMSFKNAHGLNTYAQVRAYFNQKVSSVITQRTGFARVMSGGGSTPVRIAEAPPAVSDDAPASPAVFTDLGSVSWAVEAIEILAAHHVVAGFDNNEFRPNGNVTRGQFIKMLIAALGLEDAGAQAVFTDTSPGDWHYVYIASAQKLGIANGFADGSFGVNTEITRQEMAALAYRAAQAANVRLSHNIAPVEFADKDEISSYATESISRMQTAGIINGMGDNRFAPNDPSTRAQAAKIIYGLFQLTQK